MKNGTDENEISDFAILKIGIVPYSSHYQGFGWYEKIILINGWVISLIVGGMKCLIGELWTLH